MKTSRIIAAASAALVLAAGITSCAGTPATPEGDSPAGAVELELVSPGALTVGTDTSTKPFAYIENEEVTGFDVEIIRAIGEAVDLRVEIVAQEFSTLLPAVSNSQIDTVADSVSMTEERKKAVDFSDPYYIGSVVVLNLKGSGITDQFDSLANKKIGVLQGTAQDSIASKDFTESEIARFPDNNLMFQALKNGTIDGMFFDRPSAVDFTDANPDMKLQIGYGIATTDTPAGFPVKQGNDALREKLNEGIQKIVADGTYVKIFERFFPGAEIPEQFRPAA